MPGQIYQNNPVLFGRASLRALVFLGVALSGTSELGHAYSHKTRSLRAFHTTWVLFGVCQ